MIDYEARDWYGIVFKLKGSVLPRLTLRIVAAAAVGAGAAWLYVERGAKVPTVAHTLIGVALGLLLVFRTNASYDRYWEGRRLLGAIVNRTRDLARQFRTWVDDEPARNDLVRLVAAYYTLTSMTLRRERDLSKVKTLTDAEKKALEPLNHRAPVLVTWIGQRAIRYVESEQRLFAIDQNLTALNDALGGAERILKTPIPFAYAQHIKTFVTLFVFTAPFAMAETMKWWTPLASALLAFALIGIDEIGVEIEDPFGYDENDLPLDAIGAGIDAATREIVESRLPLP